MENKTYNILYYSVITFISILLIIEIFNKNLSSKETASAASLFATTILLYKRKNRLNPGFAKKLLNNKKLKILFITLFCGVVFLVYIDHKNRYECIKGKDLEIALISCRKLTESGDKSVKIVGMEVLLSKKISIK